MIVALPFPNISPEIFSISIGGFEFALRWYALSYIVGILLAWRIGAATLRRTHLWKDNTAPMTPDQADDLVTWLILGVIIGGRLGFVLFYNPSYYMANPAEIPQIWLGGMSFHGGFLGVVLACVLYARRNNIPMLPLADVMGLATPIALLLGRLANFINGELWGRPTDLPWGVVFPGLEAQNCPGVVDLCARHPSQLYEALLEGLILGLLAAYLAYRRGWLKTPGAILGLFLLGYGGARFLVEFVRQPDLQFVSTDNPVGYALHFGGYGLTQGQILSLPMILVGGYFLSRALRRHGA